VPDPFCQTGIVNAGGHARSDAEPLLDLAQCEDAGVGGELPAIEAGEEGLAGDR